MAHRLFYVLGDARRQESWLRLLALPRECICHHKMATEADTCPRQQVSLLSHTFLPLRVILLQGRPSPTRGRYRLYGIYGRASAACSYDDQPDSTDVRDRLLDDPHHNGLARLLDSSAWRRHGLAFFLSPLVTAFHLPPNPRAPDSVSYLPYRTYGSWVLIHWMAP